MTLTDKLAALPKMPDAMFYADWRAYYYDRAKALEARNTLLCEALREFSKDAAKRPMAHLVGWRALSEAEKVLAACEVKP